MLKHKSIGLNVRIDLAMHRRLRLAVASRDSRFKIVHAVQEAIEKWLDQEEAKPAAR